MQHWRMVGLRLCLLFCVTLLVSCANDLGDEG
jgi:hypothetical protein